MSIEEIENQQQLSPEQAADLAALQGFVESESVITDPDAPPPLDLAKEFSTMITIAVTTLKPALPSLGEIYTEQTIDTVSVSVAAVCNKHGWLQNGMFAEWGEEISAAFVIIPLAIATKACIAGDIARAKAKNGVTATLPAENQAKAPENSKTVTFGAVAHDGVH